VYRLADPEDEVEARNRDDLRTASVTIRLDEPTIAYFKALATELDVPYQTLINLYLRDCAATSRRPAMHWRPSRSGAA
jgi:predicted DNA binding CopG/RHH family protein